MEANECQATYGNFSVIYHFLKVVDNIGQCECQTLMWEQIVLCTLGGHV